MFHRFSVIALLLAASLVVSGAAMVRAQQPAFLSVIEDLPLMPGLNEESEGALEFETAAGRIVEITATGAVSVNAVTTYYSRSLPQLGWQMETPTRYFREDERLVIEILDLDQNQARVEVHFKLSPLSNK